jgi:hypothetical protein
MVQTFFRNSFDPPSLYATRPARSCPASLHLLWGKQRGTWDAGEYASSVHHQCQYCNGFPKPRTIAENPATEFPKSDACSFSGVHVLQRGELVRDEFKHAEQAGEKMLVNAGVTQKAGDALADK